MSVTAQLFRKHEAQIDALVKQHASVARIRQQETLAQEIAVNLADLGFHPTQIGMEPKSMWNRDEETVAAKPPTSTSAAVAQTSAKLADMSVTSQLHMRVVEGN